MKPLVSITILVRDTGAILDEFLLRLKSQVTNYSYELVVIYFGDGKKTYNKVKLCASKIKKIKKEDFNYGETRDLACRLASGKYIVSVSVDALPINKFWLQNLIEPLVLKKADVVQGVLQCPNSDDLNYLNFFYWERNYWFYFTSEGGSFLKRNSNFKSNNIFGLSCVNLAFTKEVWKETGFSGARYCEDKVFQKKAFEKGYKFIYQKNSIVLHAHSYKTIYSLFKRCSNEGLGWRDIGSNYGIYLLLKDIFRLDIQFLTLRALLKKDLKFLSEALFVLIRPIGLFWGNKFAKSVYQ